jgi:hypothetical protein
LTLRWGRKWLQGEDYSFLVKPTRQSRESGGTQLSTLNKTDPTSLGGHEKYTAAQLDWSDVQRIVSRLLASNQTDVAEARDSGGSKQSVELGSDTDMLLEI